jgi:hypothetical protein
MKQSSLINVIDLLSFIALVAMISTGALLEFTLPIRSGPSSVWGLTRHEWGDWHAYVSLAFLLLMSAHLFVHFKYIKCVVIGKATREQNYRIAIGLVGIVTLLALAVAPVVSPVDESSDARRGYHGNRPW